VPLVRFNELKIVPMGDSTEFGLVWFGFEKVYALKEPNRRQPTARYAEPWAVAARSADSRRLRAPRAE